MVTIEWDLRWTNWGEGKRRQPILAEGQAVEEL